MPAESAIQIEGLRTLQRAFAVASKEMAKDLRSALESAAQPVSQDAEQLAVQRISRIGIPWSRMRIVQRRGSVYVAPVERGTRAPGRRREKFAPLLLGEAMEPALEQNRSKVIGEINDAIDDMAKAWGRVG